MSSPYRDSLQERLRGKVDEIGSRARAEELLAHLNRVSTAEQVFRGYEVNLVDNEQRDVLAEILRERAAELAAQEAERKKEDERSERRMLFRVGIPVTALFVSAFLYGLVTYTSARNRAEEEAKRDFLTCADHDGDGIVTAGELRLTYNFDATSFPLERLEIYNPDLPVFMGDASESDNYRAPSLMEMSGECRYFALLTNFPTDKLGDLTNSAKAHGECSPQSTETVRNLSSDLL